MSDIKRVIEKLDMMDSRMDNIDITLAKQHVSLDEHIRRTELLEIAREKSDEKISSLESHKDKVIGGLAILGILGSFILGLKQLGLF
jgi:hypothetical protein